jgi:hypothetical protein
MECEKIDHVEGWAVEVNRPGVCCEYNILNIDRVIFIIQSELTYVYRLGGLILLRLRRTF